MKEALFGITFASNTSSFRQNASGMDVLADHLLCSYFRSKNATFYLALVLQYIQQNMNRDEVLLSIDGSLYCCLLSILSNFVQKMCRQSGVTSQLLLSVVCDTQCHTLCAYQINVIRQSLLYFCYHNTCKCAVLACISPKTTLFLLPTTAFSVLVYLYSYSGLLCPNQFFDLYASIYGM